MAADDLNDNELWPIPPAWMMGCDTCTVLYGRMIDAREAVAEASLTTSGPVDIDPFDSGLTTQLALGQHLAQAHGPLLPDFDANCPVCAQREQDLQRTTASEGFRTYATSAAAEHRARHLIVPPEMTHQI
ncbi:hypothetical protein ABII15_38285 [Streptomyces sp. HUAS MG91]|uniref:Uncharacterized protein n=1 Tax=Streptomyces tabacisoli TaxID=3156398 RepID=A0AAU8J6D1_9ACTN